MTRRSFLTAVRNAVVAAGLSPLLAPALDLKKKSCAEAIIEQKFLTEEHLNNYWVYTVSHFPGTGEVIAHSNDSELYIKEMTWKSSIGYEPCSKKPTTSSRSSIIQIPMTEWVSKSDLTA